MTPYHYKKTDKAKFAIADLSESDIHAPGDINLVKKNFTKLAMT